MKIKTTTRFFSPSPISTTTSAGTQQNNKMIQQKSKLLAVTLAGLALVAGSANAAIVLISPGTGASDDIKNGGFESYTGAVSSGLLTWAKIDDWFNYGTDTDQNAARNSDAYEGDFRPFIEGGDGAAGRAPAVDTGHVIATGDTFDLTFHQRTFSGWDVGPDSFKAILYSTSGIIWEKTITPTLTGTWESFSENNILAANIGESLHLRFVSNAANGEFASVDAITLTANAVPEPTTTALLGLGGLALLLRRRR